MKRQSTLQPWENLWHRWLFLYKTVSIDNKQQHRILRAKFRGQWFESFLSFTFKRKGWNSAMKWCTVFLHHHKSPPKNKWHTAVMFFNGIQLQKHHHSHNNLWYMYIHMCKIHRFTILYHRNLSESVPNARHYSQKVLWLVRESGLSSRTQDRPDCLALGTKVCSYVPYK